MVRQIVSASAYRCSLKWSKAVASVGQSAMGLAIRKHTGPGASLQSRFVSAKGNNMASRINRAIELLAQGQAIYYDGPHSGHVLTHAQGREDAGTWADYMNVGMEHGAFDMTGLAEYMRGMVDGGPTRSGHRTPTVIVEAPVNGTDE